ncbi:tRNA pseudouridine(55) synthase TruB [Thermodesulforhabdus norvegica]|uniref:tRNA pseudouridine synthase B n=1 Tax=Thermodesulforhabdus norvegica TaxID=39841 RepID=A0A1I4VLA5_9BACT|nr:tRNA pseudouridine(55) synthase TruB [Thermodesulforhabdus norvegica]SFN02044.1 tRNA pseudouridine55 synthase [Thermodesulforhabdus norvegica]
MGNRELDGIIVVNKPVNMTSFSVVERIKRLIKARKVGHGGTLDPFAEGVLVVLLNRATRLADQFLESDKVYRFVLRLDAETDTLDCTGNVVRRYDGPPPSYERIVEALEKFKGEREQQIPAYSAAKINGKRLYKLARKGLQVERPYKKVRIYRLELRRYEWPRVELEVHCSKGMYVRQLGADIAGALGCCGHIEQLARLRSGPFGIEDSWTMEEIHEAVRSGSVDRLVIPMVDALEHLPEAVMEEDHLIEKLRNGQLDALWASRWRNMLEKDTPVRIVTPGRDKLLALWWPAGSRRKRDSLKVLF